MLKNYPNRNKKTIFSRAIGLLLIIPLLGAYFLPFHDVIRNGGKSLDACSVSEIIESTSYDASSHQADGPKGKPADHVGMACCMSKSSGSCCCPPTKEKEVKSALQGYSFSASPCVPLEFFRLAQIQLMTSARQNLIVFDSPAEAATKQDIILSPKNLFPSQIIGNDKTFLPFYIQFQSFRC